MTNIKLFESKKIRIEWSEAEQKWYFAIIDIIEILTESLNPRRYWSDLKRKLNTEGFIQLYEIIVQLKMISSDGNKYTTDCADARVKKFWVVFLPNELIFTKAYKAIGEFFVKYQEKFAGLVEV